MKDEMLLCLSDSHLTVYRYSSQLLAMQNVYDLSEPESLEAFVNWLQKNQLSTTTLLLDVSCEDYYEEQLPHVRGRDRGLLLNRKIAKHFPVEGYAHTALSRRLKAGRRDEVYFISGITDSSSIDPLINLLADNDVVIRGVYSLPQLAAEIIEPIEHRKKCLLVTCDGDVSPDGRYTFRQTFVIDEKLYFSRKTTVAAAEGTEIAENVRKEIERTWQYLNNRRVLELDSRMQVLMVLPRQIAEYLRSEAEASQCNYFYAAVEELASQHTYAGNADELTGTSLGVFLLATRGGRKSHYQPKRLGSIRRHQQIKRLLTSVCVFAVAIAVVFSSLNILRGSRIVDTNLGLVTEVNRINQELKSQQDSLKYSGPSPTKMQDLVVLSQHILQENALPEPVFNIVGRGFSGFNDLLLNDLEWHVLTDAGVDGAVNGGSINTQPETRVIVSLVGEVLGFDGDFRRSINRIKLLVTRLRADNSVVEVVIKRLPLDIDPSFSLSRAVSDGRTPSFAIDVTLTLAVL